MEGTCFSIARWCDSLDHDQCPFAFPKLCLYSLSSHKNVSINLSFQYLSLSFAAQDLQQFNLSIRFNFWNPSGNYISSSLHSSTAFFNPLEGAPGEILQAEHILPCLEVHTSAKPTCIINIDPDFSNFNRFSLTFCSLSLSFQFYFHLSYARHNTSLFQSFISFQRFHLTTGLLVRTLLPINQ